MQAVHPLLYQNRTAWSRPSLPGLAQPAASENPTPLAFAELTGRLMASCRSIGDVRINGVTP